MNDSRRYRVRHRTTYTYASDVLHAHQLLHLTPRTTTLQAMLAHDITILPAPVAREDDLDAFGNTITRLEFDRPHRELAVEATIDVRVDAPTDVDAAGSLPWEQVRDSLDYGARARDPASIEAVRYRVESPQVRVKHVFAAYAAPSFPAGRPVLAGAIELMHRVHRDFEYAPGATQVGTPLATVLETRRGVCQDFAHVTLAALRSLGLPARYVSGYLRTRPREGERALTGADASHAWLAVYAPPFGWVDLDPTNDLVVGTQHVTLAWGRDFGDVSPLRGVIVGGGTHRLAVAVVVSEIPAAA